MSKLTSTRFSEEIRMFVNWVDEIGKTTRKVTFSTDDMGDVHVDIEEHGESLVHKEDQNPEVAILQAALALSKLPETEKD